MGSSQHFYPESGYLSPSFPHRRAMWATAAAVACGVIGGTAGLLAVMTGHNMPPPQAMVDPGLSELWYDFAALQVGTSGMGSSTAEPGFAPPPDSANGLATPSPAADAGKRCTESTWPFFDNDCLWGKSAADGREERRHKRILARLKSPWCSSLHSKQGAYICRPRT
jgi:hypothetical protein